MPVTPIYGLPYPSLTDPPDGPDQIQALADAVEAELDRIDTNVSGVPADVISMLGVSVSDEVATLGTTPSGSYVETLTGAATCELTFTAPDSGNILVVNSGTIFNNSADQTTLQSFVIRTGSVIGSGSTVHAASDLYALRVIGINPLGSTRSTAIIGVLTGGATYNIRQAYRRSGATLGNFQHRQLSVIPIP